MATVHGDVLITPAINKLYKLLLPLVLRTDPQWAHDRFLEVLRYADDNPVLVRLAEQIGKATRPDAPLAIGGVKLPHPLILSAGMVKGDGFATETDGLDAVCSGENIIPGWRVLPMAVGAVEFGSFTRYPRLGNPGKVVWRDAATRSTQNRIGLRNPGAEAAAEFLLWHQRDLPPVFGINIAVSPGVDDWQQEQQEAVEAVRAFTKRGVQPAWFTLNLSCPNTEDDPSGNQTEAKAHTLCAALVDVLGEIPLWVKVGPCLGETQYSALMAAFAQTGVRAVIATNTLPAPTPDGTATAGIGGGKLHGKSLAAVKALMTAKEQHHDPVDVIGCGGVIDGKTYQAYQNVNVFAVQYYSATIYRSPLAAAIIHHEASFAGR